MQVLIGDLRYGIRTLAKSPGFTAVAVLTLALGIGANSAIFTWMKAIALDYLPGVDEPGRLVVLTGMNRDGTGCCTGVSYPNYRDYNQRNQVFDGILGWEIANVSLRSDRRPAERIQGSIVTGNYFEVLGAKAALGRTFLAEEDETPGTHPVVVLSHRLWQRHFNADAVVVGRNVTINGQSFTIIGVMPERFAGAATGLHFDVYIPTMMQELIWPGRNMLANRGALWLDLVGRLKPGVSVEQAKSGVDLVSTQLEQEYRGPNARRTLGVFTPFESPLGVQGRLFPVLSILMVVVGLVLLIACANVANLLLARGQGRVREIAIRMAMGASRGRIIRQLLTESLLLSLLACVAALLVAMGATHGLLELLPPLDVPLGFNTAVDRYVLGFTLIAALLTGVMFGLVPALRASGVNLAPALKDAFAGDTRSSRLQSALIVAQVTFAVVALVAAGLFLRSMNRAQNFDAGFNPENALMVSLDVFPHGYSAVRGRSFYERLLRGVETLPGVVSATYARRPPLTLRGERLTGIAEVEGYRTAPDEQLGSTFDSVGWSYFRTMEIPLLQGRDFTRQDVSGAPAVVVVNETMAQRLWPGQNPLGKRIRIGNTWNEVVGVARDVKYKRLNEQDRLYMYAPHQQVYMPDMTLIVRSSGDPAGLVEPVRREVQALDPNLPVFGVMTLRGHVNASLSPQLAAGAGTGVIGLLALGLAAVGLYGLIGYSVSQRTHEIGVRIAVGAQSADLFKMIIGRGMRLTLMGLGLGLVGAFGLTRFVSSLLFGVSASDPVTFVGSSVLLLSVALLASYIPARRATKVDPLVALRRE